MKRTIKDNTSNVSITIGGQVWMAKNLDVKRYRNGDLIPEVKEADEWANLTTGAWCYYNNQPVKYKKFGRLYNWYAVNDPRGLAPEGWHIPSLDEWYWLQMIIGYCPIAGGKLKSKGTIEERTGLWSHPNLGATDDYGFSALPGGERWWNSCFDGFTRDECWWTSTEFSLNKDMAWAKVVNTENRCLCSIGHKDKKTGQHIRCIKDP